MTPAEAIIRLAKIGYQFEVRGDRIRCTFRGPGEPDPDRVRPLLEILKQKKKEALAYLQAQDIPTCGACPHYLENPWTHYPDLKGWCGHWWDFLLGPHNPQCRDRRDGRVPDPQPQARDHDPVRRPTSRVFDPTKGLPLTCFECAHFRPGRGSPNPAQAWGQCLKTGKGRYGAARACDALAAHRRVAQERKLTNERQNCR